MALHCSYSGRSAMVGAATDYSTRACVMGAAAGPGLKSSLFFVHKDLQNNKAANNQDQDSSLIVSTKAFV